MSLVRGQRNPLSKKPTGQKAKKKLVSELRAVLLPQKNLNKRLLRKNNTLIFFAKEGRRAKLTLRMELFPSAAKYKKNSAKKRLTPKSKNFARSAKKPLIPMLRKKKQRKKILLSVKKNKFYISRLKPRILFKAAGFVIRSGVTPINRAARFKKKGGVTFEKYRKPSIVKKDGPNCLKKYTRQRLVLNKPAPTTKKAGSFRAFGGSKKTVRIVKEGIKKEKIPPKIFYLNFLTKSLRGLNFITKKVQQHTSTREKRKKQKKLLRFYSFYSSHSFKVLKDLNRGSARRANTCAAYVKKFRLIFLKWLKCGRPCDLKISGLTNTTLGGSLNSRTKNITFLPY